MARFQATLLCRVVGNDEFRLSRDDAGEWGHKVPHPLLGSWSFQGYKNEFASPLR